MGHLGFMPYCVHTDNSELVSSSIKVVEICSKGISLLHELISSLFMFWRRGKKAVFPSDDVILSIKSSLPPKRVNNSHGGKENFDL